VLWAEASGYFRPWRAKNAVGLASSFWESADSCVGPFLRPRRLSRSRHHSPRAKKTAYFERYVVQSVTECGKSRTGRGSSNTSPFWFPMSSQPSLWSDKLSGIQASDM